MPRVHYGRPFRPIVTASKTLSGLILALHEQKLSYREVAKRAGFGLNAPTRWARGINAPNILTVEALAEVLGYEIILRRKENGNGYSQDAEVEVDSNRETDVKSGKTPSRSASDALFTRTNRGADGRFVRWEV